ncbi:TPA: ead/Ea22-like family protein [Klebsiella pneumoniae]
MTDITELAKSLKAAAENAGADCWQAKKISGDFYVIRKGSYKRECGYTTYQPIAEIDHKPTRDYVAMANPANTLALVEALEKTRQRIEELESDLSEWTDCKHDGATYYDMSGQERCGRCGADI